MHLCLLPCCILLVSCLLIIMIGVDTHTHTHTHTHTPVCGPGLWRESNSINGFSPASPNLKPSGLAEDATTTKCTMLMLASRLVSGLDCWEGGGEMRQETNQQTNEKTAPIRCRKLWSLVAFLQVAAAILYY